MNRVQFPVRQRKLAWRQIIVVENSGCVQLTSRSYLEGQLDILKPNKENVVKQPVANLRGEGLTSVKRWST